MEEEIFPPPVVKKDFLRQQRIYIACRVKGYAPSIRGREQAILLQMEDFHLPQIADQKIVVCHLCLTDHVIPHILLHIGHVKPAKRCTVQIVGCQLPMVLTAFSKRVNRIACNGKSHNVGSLDDQHFFCIFHRVEYVDAGGAGTVDGSFAQAVKLAAICPVINQRR